MDAKTPSLAAARDALNYLLEYEDGPCPRLSVEGARNLDVLRRFIEAQEVLPPNDGWQGMELSNGWRNMTVAEVRVREVKPPPPPAAGRNAH